MIIRENNDCALIASEDHDDEFPLLSIQVQSDKFTIRPLDYPANQMWLVLRKLSNWKSGYILSEGDIIKLGRIKLKVKYIHNSYEESTALLEKRADLSCDQDANTCRICFSEQLSDQDPLIAPCRCDGSMKYVHIACLQNWLNLKISFRRTNKSSSYYWKDIKCELCKARLPSSIKLNNKEFDIVPLAYPGKPYIILEDLRTNRNQSYGMHLITLEPDASMLIGRAHESDVKLSDISVSRQHAKIKNLGNDFYISDLDSKFGTLLLQKNPIDLEEKSNITVQVSRCVISLKVKKSCSWICYKNKIHPGYSIVRSKELEEPSNRNLIVSIEE